MKIVKSFLTRHVFIIFTELHHLFNVFLDEHLVVTNTLDKEYFITHDFGEMIVHFLATFLSDVSTIQYLKCNKKQSRGQNLSKARQNWNTNSYVSPVL